MNKQRILLMFANEYDMKDDDGRRLSGVSLNYFFWGDHGEMLAAKTGSTGSIGYQRAKCSVDYDLRDKIKSAPAVYDADFIMSVGSDGKPVLKVTDLKFVSGVEFKALVDADKKS